MDKTTLIVTGAGGPASIGFCRSLNDAETPYEIIGIDCDKYHIHLAETDYKYLGPKIDDPNYLDFINYIAEKHNAVFLHSQPDVEIEFLSENREKLNVKTNFPPKEVVRNCIDKFVSYNYWTDNNVPTPRTQLLHSEIELKAAFDVLGPKIWLRNIVGAAGKGSIATDDYNEALEWLNMWDGWGHFTAAELLSDRTITWQSIWNRGQLVVAQTRERAYWEFANRSVSGVTGLTGTGITVSDPVVDDIALRAIRAIMPNPHGIFSVDMTYSFDGVPNVTEINIARFFTTHYFFTRAGVNFPDIFVRTSLGMNTNDITKGLVNPLKSGLAWIRGIDSVPVLTTLDNIETKEVWLKDTIKEVLNGN